MSEIIDFISYSVIVLAILSFLVTLSNARFLDSLGAYCNRTYDRKLKKSVSVLVPARNEEDNIALCLEALVSQDYEPLEILVLDDQSMDRTPEIIQKFAQSDLRVRMLSGADLPEGWTGKNWACHQLSQEAKGEFLLFIDVDTIVFKGVVRGAVMDSLHKGSDLLTVMPHRVAACIVEKLIFTFIDWALFCWMPMKLAHNSNNPHLSATFGQFILMKREAYAVVGGHAKIRSNPLDDFELGRNTKKSGLRWTLCEGVNRVQVLSYKGNIDAFKGVSRSVFPALYYSFTLLTLLSIVLLALSVIPFMMLVIGIWFYPNEIDVLVISVSSITIFSIPWVIVCLKFNRSLLTVFFYPLAIALMIMVGFHSMIAYSLGRQKWKGRSIKGSGT